MTAQECLFCVLHARHFHPFLTDFGPQDAPFLRYFGNFTSLVPILSPSWGSVLVVDGVR